MLLSNLSVDPKAAAQVMGDDLENKKAGPGTEVMRLVKLFGVDPKSNVTGTGSGSGSGGSGGGDSYQYIANVLTNVTQLESARNLIVDPKFGLLKVVATQLASPNVTRRVGTLRTLRNLCFDPTHTETIIRDDAIFTALCVPLIGPEQLDSDDLAKMKPLALRQRMNDRLKTRDESIAVCRAALELLMLCVHHKPTRLLLKSSGVYFIIREYHNSIREKEPELDEFCEELVPFLLLDEAPEPKSLPLLEAPTAAPTLHVNSTTPAPAPVPTPAAAADTKSAPKPIASTDSKSAAPTPTATSTPARAPTAAELAEEERSLKALNDARNKRLQRETADAQAAAAVKSSQPAKSNDNASKPAAAPAPTNTAAAAAAKPAPAPVPVVASEDEVAPLSEVAKIVPVEKLLARSAAADDDDAPDLID